MRHREDCAQLWGGVCECELSAREAAYVRAFAAATAKGRQVRECGCVYEWQTVRDRQVVRVMLCWEHLPKSDKWITIDVPGVS